MKIEVIAIAEEILKGFTVNTNAGFLSRELCRRGYSVSRHIALPDDASIMEHALREALARSSVVITTGGLGPTLDDLTKRVLAKIFNSELHLNNEIAEDLSKRYKDLPSLQEQATVPQKALILKNRLGTAPGFAFTEKGKTLIALPGVPREMEEMFLLEALPFLEKHLPLEKKLYSKEVYFAILSETAVDAFLLAEMKNDSGIEIGLYPSLGSLQVVLSVYAKDEKEAAKKIDPLKTKLSQHFAKNYLESESGKIEEAVQRDFIKKRKTLAIAESCTGGQIAKQITSLPDSSQYFLGSIVCYSNQLKKDLLQVSSQTLEEKGAVSKESAEEMIRGLFLKTSCDYAIAVTGIAGPSGGTIEKPVGTVFVALGERGGKMVSGKIQAKGRNRSGIIEYTSNFCLFSLWKFFTENSTPMFL